MLFRSILVSACLLPACGQPADPPTTTTARITCTATPDCSARGGTCVAGECRADNECTTDADCAAGQTCEADADFGGLCVTDGQPAAPAPAWSCTYGKDCPAGQGCGSDGTCHVDGECHNTWGADGYLHGDCANPEDICASSGPDPLAGFCTSGRGGPDPYCRSTGTGECRSECATDEDCGTGFSCGSGYCYADDECETTADCSPNHTCGTPEGWDDYGYQRCLTDENPTCVDDGQGACRLPCDTDADCIEGGGCAADNLCHASNECTDSSDCDPGLECYPTPTWGGLCAPPRT